MSSFGSCRPHRIVAIALAGGAALALAGCASASGASAAAAATPVLRTIVINGEGEISAVPDQVRLTAGVATQAPTAAAVLDANSTTMNRIYAVLRQMGVGENNIQTSNFLFRRNIRPQH
jgi:uncharacterized protein